MTTRIFATTLAGAFFCTAAAFSQTPSAPTSTDVIVATVRVLSPTDPADRFEIIDAAIRQGFPPRHQPATVYNGTYTEEMALHEFGHSFGDLCD